MTEIPIERITRDVDTCFVDATHSYHLSYRHFVDYFSAVRKITEHHLIIGASFAYSWMPTILTIHAARIDQAVEALNRARFNDPIGRDDLEVLKLTINNSMVGSSKLLHFVNPQVYPIIDSKVYLYLHGKHSDHKLNSPNRYADYASACRHAVESPAFGLVFQRACERLGFEVSPLRALELVMYSSIEKEATD